MEGVFENNVTNSVVEYNTGKLTINKTARDAMLANTNFKFIATITGTFEYDVNGNGSFDDPEDKSYKNIRRK